MKKYLLLLLIPVLAYAGRLQNTDFKTEAEITGAGGAVSQLLNDTKIYVTSGAINKTLDDAITDGDIGFQSPMTTNGDLIYYNSGANRLPGGTNGFLLTMVAGLPGWSAAPVATTLTTKGDIQTYNTANARLPVGVDGEWLVADSAEATGLKYTDTLQGRLNPVTDWVNFTPNGTWITNSTYTGKWRRVGDTAEIQMTVSLSGAPTTSDLIFDYSSIGVTSDNTKLTTASLAQSLGEGWITDNGARSYIAAATWDTSTTVRVRHTESGNFANVNQANPITFTNLDKVSVVISVPIENWTSGVDAIAQNKKLAVVNASNNAGTAFTSSTNIPYTIEAEDNYNAWNGSEFTAPHTNMYAVDIGTHMVASVTNQNTSVYVDTGSGYAARKVKEMTSTAINTSWASFLVKLNAGDKMVFRRSISGTWSNTNLYHSLSIVEQPSIPTIAAAIDSQKWECEKKYLSVNNTTIGNVSDLTHTAVIGKKYMYRGQTYGNAGVATQLRDNTTVLARNYTSGGAIIGAINAGCFTAASTTIYFYKEDTGATSGDGTLAETWTELCLVPDNYECN